jgi:hypothetical protein
LCIKAGAKVRKKILLTKYFISFLKNYFLQSSEKAAKPVGLAAFLMVMMRIIISRK